MFVIQSFSSSPGSDLGIMTVNPQYDIGYLSFSAVRSFRTLLQATTVDEVHLSAITAVITLGSTLTVCPDLIGKAVNVLGGTASIRAQNLQRTIGLNHGGTAAAIRSSCPAVQCFLLITALRLHLAKAEIALVLYEMLAQGDLLKKSPVSPAQLSALIGTIEPNVQQLLASERVSDLIVSPVTDYLCNLPPRSPALANSAHLFAVLPAADLARVLTSVFAALADETHTSRIELYGRLGGIWLSSLFAWLLPPQTSVHVDKTPIFPATPSNPKPRLTILLDLTTSDLTEWHVKAHQNIAQLSALLWDNGRVPGLVAKALLPQPANAVARAMLGHVGPRVIDMGGRKLVEAKPAGSSSWW